MARRNTKLGGNVFLKNKPSKFGKKNTKIEDKASTLSAPTADSKPEVFEIQGKKFVNIDDRNIDISLYPEGFNFSLLEGAEMKPNTPLLNYNNMCMEVHIVDEKDFKFKPHKYDEFDLYGPPEHDLKDVERSLFPSQQSHIGR